MKLLTVLFGFFLVASLHAEQILLINSYHPSYPWSRQVQEVLVEGLAREGHELVVEYLYSREQPFEEAAERLVRVLEIRYSDRFPDLVVTIDDNALKFMRDYRVLPLVDVPVFFCGVNNPPEFSLEFSATGVVSQLDFGRSFEILRDLFPERNHYYIIHDGGETGTGVYRAISETWKDIEIVNPEVFMQEINSTDYILEELLMQEFWQRSDSLALFINWNIDRNGSYRDSWEAADFLGQRSEIPVFSLLDYHSSILGGHITLPERHGQDSLEQIVEMLRTGNPPPIIYDGSNYLYFNYPRVRKWQIRLGALKEEYDLLLTPETLWYRYQDYVLLTIILSVVFITIILFLIVGSLKRKALNQELETALEAAKESEELKSAFLSNISHEVRTPLNAIQGFSGMLVRGGQSAGERRQYGDIIQNSVSSLVSLFDQIIDLSRLSRDRLKLQFREININSLILELFDEFTERGKSPLFVGKDIAFFFNLGLPDESARFHTDPGKLKRILVNLIENAIKFTEKGSVEWGYRLLENQFLEFYVLDTGIGIAEEHQAKIFDLFRQVDGSYSRLYGGSGLGLTICKNYVEKMGGSIRVVSQPEKGTAFFFTLPFRKVSEN